MPAHYNAHANIQYLNPLEQFYIAFPVSPNLQSMHSGAQRVQQHASQKRYANPHA